MKKELGEQGLQLPPELWMDEINTTYNGQWVMSKITEYEEDQKKARKARVIKHGVDFPAVYETFDNLPDWVGGSKNLLLFRASIPMPEYMMQPVNIQWYNEIYKGKYKIVREEREGESFIVFEEIKENLA